jgi:CDP-4-dehydro-6-deoxyglucose reductase
MENEEFQYAEIINIIEINTMVKRFFLKFPHDITFQSGQFVIIDFGKLNHTYSTRSYSIADFSQGNILELCVSLKENGAATPLLFRNKIGDQLKVSIPQGRFVLPDFINTESIGFICTGTGVAPFRAMIKDLLEFRKFTGKVYLFFGGRTQIDILYREEFEELQNKYSNFHYTPVLSRETWNGANGYVHKHYECIFKDKPNAIIYLCGWTDMIKETRDQLKSFGYTRSEIKVEFYD